MFFNHPFCNFFRGRKNRSKRIHVVKIPFSMDDLTDVSIPDFDNENYDSTFRVFSPFPQLDGNDDLQEQEIEIVPVYITPKRYIF